jgi:hypothetical protein
MQIELDNVERAAIVGALTEAIDRLCVALVTVREGRREALSTERAYLVALRMRIHNAYGVLPVLSQDNENYHGA